MKLIGPSGTLAGDISRLKSDLPPYNCDLEIIGDDVGKTERKLIVFEDVDPELEDCSEEVAQLPLITFDIEKHLIKHPTYKRSAVGKDRRRETIHHIYQQSKCILRCPG